MVARARLLQHPQVLLELASVEEGGAVDAGEHLAVLVAAPVCAGDRAQLERLDPARRGAVRPTAQVHERPVSVQRDGLHPLVADQVLDQLHLVRLVLGPEALDRVRGCQLGALKGLVGLDVEGHPLLDSRQVRLRRAKSVGELEVVVEALLDRRADRDLGARPQVEHGGGQDMGAVVAKDLERLRTARGEDLDPLPVGQRHCQVADLTVHPDREGVLRQARADRRRGVGAGRALLELERGLVGQLHRQVGHRGHATRGGNGRTGLGGHRDAQEFVRAVDAQSHHRRGWGSPLAQPSPRSRP